jgi:NAD(P)-dependent dehydrogenase (short-subunit alcohol dehydrogenase family)
MYRPGKVAAGEAADLQAVLITGAGGLIGHAVARQLAAASRSVVAPGQVPVPRAPCLVVPVLDRPALRRSG